MSNVLVATFNDPAAAESVMQALNVTVSYRQAMVSDICLVKVDNDGRMDITQKFARPDHFFLAGLVVGAVAGAVSGLTFFSMVAMPIAILAGAIGGLGVAAAYAMFTDIGLSDDLLQQLGSQMGAGRAAIAVLHKPEAQKWLTSALEKGGAEMVMNVSRDARSEDDVLRSLAAMQRV